MKNRNTAARTLALSYNIAYRIISAEFLIGIIFFGDSADAARLIGAALILAGVITLKLAG